MDYSLDPLESMDIFKSLVEVSVLTVQGGQRVEVSDSFCNSVGCSRTPGTCVGFSMESHGCSMLVSLLEESIHLVGRGASGAPISFQVGSVCDEVYQLYRSLGLGVMRGVFLVLKELATLTLACSGSPKT